MTLFQVAAKRRSGVIAWAVLLLSGGLVPVALSAEDAHKIVRDYAPLERLASDSVNAFSLELFRILAKEEGGNMAVSPYSLDRALAAVAYGATGETRTELLGLLRMIPSHPFRGNAGVHYPLSLLSRRLARDRGDFSGTDMMLHAGDLNLKKEFIEGAEALYGIRPLACDFSKPGETVAAINSLAEQSTGGMIKEIIGESALSPASRMVILDTILFTGKWEEAFSPGDTREGEFQAADGPMTVSYMSKSLSLPLIEIAGEPAASAISIPFRNGEWEMVFFKPGDLGGFLDRLVPEAFCEWMDALDAAKGVRKRMKVSIPRFSFAWEAKNLREILGRMGMGRAFSASDAQFGGIADGERLYLSDVLHRTRIELDESGSRAAAASAVVVAKSLAVRTREFRLDRPFVFIVRHAATGAAVLLGKVAKPLSE
ncbi:MAG: serpin family protein [Planctomycetota bacterium]|nr:serpin family protein [Planctomycetota bacterium]